MLKLFSELLNGAVVSSVVAVALLAAPAAPTPLHVGFNCVRPFFHETMKVANGSPRVVKEFAGFRLCRETLPTDANGFVVFPEA